MKSSLIAGIVSLVLGVGVASASVVGVVSAQQSTPDKSPGNIEQPTIEYGSR